jgi:XRE family transcriptional regulator, regulator of sulfur utilization
MTDPSLCTIILTYALASLVKSRARVWEDVGMNISRRDLGLLLPALASRAGAQQAARHILPTKVYRDSQISYTGDAQKKGREFFHGTTHSDFGLQMHETILGPGIQTHEPHKHEHEEIVIVFEGTMEAWMEGKTELAEAGSVVYFGSNQMHSSRNAGTVQCRYYVIELRGKEA